MTHTVKGRLFRVEMMGFVIDYGESIGGPIHHYKAVLHGNQEIECKVCGLKTRYSKLRDCTRNRCGLDGVIITREVADAYKPTPAPTFEWVDDGEPIFGRKD